MKNKFFKLYVSPFQIKTSIKIQTRLRQTSWATRKWLESLVPTTTLQALNLPTKLTFEMSRNESFDVEKKVYSKFY